MPIYKHQHGDAPPSKVQNKVIGLKTAEKVVSSY